MALPLRYDKYTLEELQTSCLQQFGQLPNTLLAGKVAMRKELIRYLEEQDEEREPVSSNPDACFEGLPPELRLEIYEHHFGYLEERVPRHALIMLTQPPITMVSKKLRKESLPSFYDHCTSTIYVRYDSGIPLQITSPSTVRFLRQALVACLTALRKLQLRGSMVVDASRTLAILHWRVDLSPQSTYQIEWDAHGFRNADSAACAERKKDLQTRVQAFFTARRNADGVFRLKRGDDDAVVAMLG